MKKEVEEKYKSGLRHGAGAVILFVVTPIVMVWLEGEGAPLWIKGLIISFLWLGTIFWLAISSKSRFNNTNKDS